MFWLVWRRDVSRLYLLLVLPMLLALNFVFVPFHAPDDYDHVRRAYAFAHGVLWPVTEAGKMTGGYIDANLSRMIEAQKSAVHGWPRTGPLSPQSIPDASSRAARNLSWSGSRVYNEFPGSTSYLPLVYVPQSAALWIGEVLALSVERSVFLARLLNGATAVVIVAAALAMLPFGAGSVLLVLLLPKTLVQFASNSADPMLHALTLAIIAVSSRALIGEWIPRTRHFLLIALCLLVLTGARPPLAALMLLPLWVAWRQRNLWAAAALVAAVALAALWFAAVIPLIVDTRCGPTGTLTSKTLAFLAHGPLLVARSLWWYKQYYSASFVGELGWGNGPASQLNWLPLWIYFAAAVMLPLALAYDMGQPVQPPRAWRAVLLLAASGIAVAIFFVMYLGCTNPASLAIGGVQGRYFVPSVLLGAAALAGLMRPLGTVQRLYPPALVLFALLAFGLLVSEGLRIYWAN